MDSKLSSGLEIIISRVAVPPSFESISEVFVKRHIEGLHGVQ